MQLEDHQRDSIIEEFSREIQRLKSDIMEGRRSEDDYPVRITEAADLLSRALEHLPARDALQSAQSPKASDRSTKALGLRFLKSEKWDQEKVRRKKYKNGPSYSYKFFLPGDEHFVERPRSHKEYVRLLFKLERTQQRSQAAADPQSSESPSQSNNEAFETEVRRAYADVVGRTRGAAYVRIPELRRELNIADEVFQQGLLALRDEGKVILSKHGFAASLSREDREASIELSPGEYYYYMTLRDDM